MNLQPTRYAQLSLLLPGLALGQLLTATLHIGQAAETDDIGGELTAREIIDKAGEAAKRNGKGAAIFTYLRKARVEEIDSDGNTRKEYTKTYRAYTNGSDQELLSVDGQPASPKQIEQESEKNRKQQRRYLARSEESDSGRDENLIKKNTDLFREKFTPVLSGRKLASSRSAYVIELQPNTSHKLKSRTLNRLMNQLDAELWVDREEFQIAKIEAKLREPVSFLGGLAGAVKAINITVSQKRLALDTWVDESVSANFDVRVFWKTYKFRMKSQSSQIEPAPPRNHSPELEN
ncbi:MAG TPA: hypothetical protein QGH16_05925 [Verrucomicrobiota bacterium]|mgnify:CR=1 FL=1|jgi:hypothetical protein|nr:hypothetical protein [Verrucomicrobiota bacterium]